MNDKQLRMLLSPHKKSGPLLLALPPILLIIVVIGLLVLTVSACIKFTKGPLSTAALLRQLQSLRSKFVAGSAIDPEAERKEMEILQNKLKTSSDPAIISANGDLKQLFDKNCQSIHAVLKQPLLENRTSWIKLNALMVDFNTHYYGKRDDRER